MIKFLSAFLLVISVLQAHDYATDEDYALTCDANDPCHHLREKFCLPVTDGKTQIYFCGHSLGLQPKATRALMQEELDAWATLGVEGHFKEKDDWYSYHTFLRDSLARLAGAYPHEVVAMNSLTVNLHLMMVSFYRPTKTRYKILMEAPVFSSDTYAVKSQIQFHGFDPSQALVVASPREGEDYLRMEDVEAILEEQGDEIALVMFSGVNYLTGQLIDMKRITKKAHAKGCLVGFDLAHTIGNVPLHLHDWDVDWAAWCSYKYLNAGPGAIGGVYVHERHGSNASIPRFAGWWGNDPNTRFQLHLQPEFVPVASADSWQISNPTIFGSVPLRASLQVFDTVGMDALREKSIRLTGYLEFLLDQIRTDRISIITPRDPSMRGCQLSFRVDDRPLELLEKLKEKGVIFDFRRPNVLRVAPKPLYNTFHEVWQFANILKEHLEEEK